MERGGSKKTCTAVLGPDTSAGEYGQAGEGPRPGSKYMVARAGTDRNEAIPHSVCQGQCASLSVFKSPSMSALGFCFVRVSA
jgi:hypothetical protein